MRLYKENRPEWVKKASLSLGIRIASMPDSEVRRIWGTIERDYQVATWGHLSEDQQERIKGLR